MPLTDVELDAFAQWAQAEQNRPVAALVDELRTLRAARRPVAVVIVEPHQGALLPLFATIDQPLVVLAPEGLTLQVDRTHYQAARVTLESYDGTSAEDLWRRLRAHGVCV